MKTIVPCLFNLNVFSSCDTLNFGNKWKPGGHKKALLAQLKIKPHATASRYYSIGGDKWPATSLIASVRCG